MKTYTFYCDPGHGWLKVEKKELIELGIADNISHCSYSKGEFAYLEEDCDVAIFLRAKGLLIDDKMSHEFKYKSQHTNRSSRIRNYPSYTPPIQEPKKVKTYYYVNTDTRDIDNKQIGVHCTDTINREFCIGVNHSGTKESVKEATRIAKIIAKALNNEKPQAF